MTAPLVRSLPDAETHAAPGRVASARVQAVGAAAEIAGLQWLSGEVIRLDLALPPAARFDYRPGQYLAVLPEDGLPRCFSMASPQADGLLELHVRHWPDGTFSHWLASGARIGDRIRIEGPYGNFIWRSEESAGVILLATGTGVAPMIAMLSATLADPRAHVPIRLYWGVRRHAELYRALQFRRWEKEHPRFSFVPVVSRRDGAGGDWPNAMRVQDLALAEVATLRGVDVYASGAPAMVSDAREKFFARSDMSAERFFSDAFEPARNADAVEPASGAITLSLRRETGVCAVPARIGERLLAALKRGGLPLLAVCGGQASCATCRVNIAPDWRQRLSPAGKVERNLLASLPECQAGDRLACQITVTAELDGLEICPTG